MRSYLILFAIFSFFFLNLSSIALAQLIPSPTPTPLPTPTATTETNSPCADKTSVYPPNSKCYPKVEKIEKNIEDYPLTCISAPNIVYKGVYTGSIAPFFVDVAVTHDISKATLGGYGPDLNTMINTRSPDSLAKSYLFSSLFDKPNYFLEDTPREAWRTFWRLLSSRQQANVKAAYLQAIDSQQKNVYWHYYDKNGNDHETNAKELRSKIDGFLGLIRGCLTSNPVCDKYASEYLKLDETTKNMYDTLLPYDFDNLRGFIALGSQVSRENIPYIEAILSGISGEKGLFAHLTPDWAYANPENITTTTDENSLLNRVIARAASFKCGTPPKSSGIPAPKTYPSSPALGQIVRVPVTAKEISNEPDRCTCSSVNCRTYHCSYYRRDIECIKRGCEWIEGKTEFELSGEATGKSIAVLNNPKVDQITDMVVGNSDKKITSFFKMLLPSFAKVPDKVIINASSVSNSSNPPAAISGATTIWRENNLAQDTMHLLQNCWLLPSEGQSSSKCGKKQTEVLGCNGELMKQVVGDPPKPSNLALSYFSSYILPNLNTTVIDAYSQAEAETGVPCEVLAGIHFEEGGNDPGKSLQDGSPLQGTLVDSAIRAANELKGKAGGNISDINTLIRALSWYNGGGNSNCQSNYSCPAASSIDRCGLTIGCAQNPDSCVCRPGLVPEPGSCRASCNPNSFPYSFSYSYCPPPGTGYDDPYVTNWWQSPQHDEMYLLYQYDCTRTRPQIHIRPGSLTVALSLLLHETQ